MARPFGGGFYPRLRRKPYVNYSVKQQALGLGTTTMNHSLSVALWLLMAAISLGGCTSDAGTPAQDTLFRKVSDAVIQPGDPIPPPQGDVVLTVTGKFGTAANTGDTLQFDLQTLESLGLVEIHVDDWLAEGREVDFQGILLRQLLDVIRVPTDAQTLQTVALNDYAVQIPVADAYAYPVLIATRADGAVMTIEHYGPIRIVYPFGLMQLDEGLHRARSIWQLFRIRVE